MARKRESKGEYEVIPVRDLGQFTVNGPLGPVSRPVRQGLALDIARVFNSGAVMPPALWPQEGDVVVKVMGNGDHYRMVSRQVLYDIAVRVGRGSADIAHRDKDLWRASRPTEVGGSDGVDYEIVQGDKDSWRDLRMQLVEEEIDALEEAQPWQERPNIRSHGAKQKT